MRSSVLGYFMSGSNKTGEHTTLVLKKTLGCVKLGNNTIVHHKNPVTDEKAQTKRT